MDASDSLLESTGQPSERLGRRWGQRARSRFRGPARSRIVEGNLNTEYTPTSPRGGAGGGGGGGGEAEAEEEAEEEEEEEEEDEYVHGR